MDTSGESPIVAGKTSEEKGTPVSRAEGNRQDNAWEKNPHQQRPSTRQSTNTPFGSRLAPSPEQNQDRAFLNA